LQDDSHHPSSINSQENELGDSSQSNYTFGDAGIANNALMIDMIGEDHDEIPSESD
jgi:hypothetical protein